MILVRRLGRNCLMVVAIVIAFYVLDWALNAMRSRLVPKNFAAVEDGVLYRSGQLRPDHFERVIREHRIRTVVCLNPNDVPDEKSRAERLGVDWRGFPMPGSGQGQAEQFRAILDLIADPKAQPVLVHCAAGAYRTGATCALFRIVQRGWQFDDAVREMKFFGFAGQRDLIDHVEAVLASLPDRGRQLR